MTSETNTVPEVRMQPIGDRVLLHVIQQEDVRPSGLVIPDQAKERPETGIVVIKGDGRMPTGEQIDMAAVDRGDRVVFSKFAGTIYREDDRDYLLVRMMDILGKLPAGGT